MPFGMKTHLHGTDPGKGMTRIQRKDEMQRQKAMELTSYMLHKYYCENDVEAVIALMDDDIVWLGTGEEEHSRGTGEGGRDFPPVRRAGPPVQSLR